MYIYKYLFPIGYITLQSDGEGLTGLSLKDCTIGKDEILKELPIFRETRHWLQIYFDGREPDFTPPVKAKGTDFQKAVWEILCKIPYGETTTYGEIAKQLAAIKGIPKMSAQAVGNAISKNPVSVIVPCHRVIGADGSPVGYAAGLDKKAFLLETEGIYVKKCR